MTTRVVGGVFACIVCLLVVAACGSRPAQKDDAGRPSSVPAAAAQTVCVNTASTPPLPPSVHATQGAVRSYLTGRAASLSAAADRLADVHPTSNAKSFAAALTLFREYIQDLHADLSGAQAGAIPAPADLLASTQNAEAAFWEQAGAPSCSAALTVPDQLLFEAGLGAETSVGRSPQPRPDNASRRSSRK